MHTRGEKPIDGPWPVCPPSRSAGDTCYERVDWYCRRKSHRASARKWRHLPWEGREVVRSVGEMNIIVSTQRWLLQAWVRGAGEDFDQWREGNCLVNPGNLVCDAPLPLSSLPCSVLWVLLLPTFFSTAKFEGEPTVEGIDVLCCCSSLRTR